MTKLEKHRNASSPGSASVQIVDNGNNMLLTLEYVDRSFELKIDFESWLQLCMDSLNAYGYAVCPMASPTRNLH